MGRLEYTRLRDSLLAGRMPVSARHIDQLSAEGVTTVINLCEDREYWDGEREAVACACARAGITEHRLAVIDGATVPSDVLEQAVEVAAELQYPLMWAKAHCLDQVEGLAFTLHEDSLEFAFGPFIAWHAVHDKPRT